MDFLQNFHSFVLELPSSQKGNFVEKLCVQVARPEESFLHVLSRKIDIQRQVFVAYDQEKDLKNTSDETIDANQWLRVLYLLTYFFWQSKEVGIRYKAFNTLCKVRDLLPESCLSNAMIQQGWERISKQVL